MEPTPRRTARLAAAVLGVAGAVVLATSGSLPWGAVRAAVALALAAAVVAAQRRGPWVAGWAAVGLGVIALPAAGVVAADHLAAGVRGRGGAALLAALAAGVLLVAGAATLVRATPGWWRLVAVPVALVLAQLVMVPVAQAVLVTNRAPTPIGEATPADRGLAFEDVSLRTADGVALAAWYVPSRDGAAVLLLHGSGSTRAATLDHAQVLAGRGYGVLMVDARGHGASGGTAMALGWHGADDLVPAVDWLVARSDVDPDRIGAVGLSMGGEEAITAAANDPRIRVVVADGAGVRVAADVAPQEAGGWLPRLVNAVGTALTDWLTVASPPEPLRDALARIGPPRQVLLVAARGEEDQARWYAGSSDAVAVWEVPDAGHTRALDEHPQEWAGQVDALLRGALREEETER